MLTNVGSKIPTGTIFQDEENAIFIPKDVEEANDVGVVDGGEEVELAVQAGPEMAIETGEMNLLHRHNLIAIDDVLGLPHCRETPSSKLRFYHILSHYQRFLPCRFRFDFHGWITPSFESNSDLPFKAVMMNSVATSVGF